MTDGNLNPRQFGNYLPAKDTLPTRNWIPKDEHGQADLREAARRLDTSMEAEYGLGNHGWGVERN